MRRVTAAVAVLLLAHAGSSCSAANVPPIDALDVPPIGAANVWTLDKVPYVPGAVLDDALVSAGDFLPNNPNRQHLSLALVPGATGRTGVHLYAHGSGGDVDLNPEMIDTVRAAGYAFLSWESVTDMGDSGGFTKEQKSLTCIADLDLVLAWLVDNAGAYGLDLNDVNFGGRSRGSICSWQAAHANHTKLTVSGIYMYSALPFRDAPESIVPFANNVTANSPRAYLAYGMECPKPIQSDGCQSGPPPPGPPPYSDGWAPEPSPDWWDVHNPRFGQKIVERYAALGITDRIKLTDGMQNAGINNIYYYFNESLSLPRPSATDPPTPATTPAPGPAPPGPTPAPPSPTPAPTATCVDNDDKIVALAESAGVTLSGCADPMVARRCNFSKVRQLCCAFCAARGGGNQPSRLPTASASEDQNPFADAGDEVGTSGAARQGNWALAGAAALVGASALNFAC